MDGRRRAPDRRSPVQPGKTGFVPFIILALVAGGMVWALRDTWGDDWFTPSQSASTGENSDGSVKSQSARGDLVSLFSGDDYPADAQMRDEQGTVRVKLAIDERGRISRCDVVGSSGSNSLDSATCRILRQRARFTPAYDSTGRSIGDTYTTSITWRLEG